MAEQSSTKDEAKTPFTIITGFLGAGKTTLINYMLTEQRDKRICVIENEFGEINIDEKLVSANMASKEDLIQMDNGCACCSIRGDLVRTLGGLVEKRQQFDAVMLETTGLADPAPIIATLKSNQWIDDNFAIDAVFASAERQGLLQFGVCRGLLLSGHGRVRRSASVSEFELPHRSSASRARSTSRRTSRSRSRTVCGGVLSWSRGGGVGESASLPGAPVDAVAETHTHTQLTRVAAGGSRRASAATAPTPSMRDPRESAASTRGRESLTTRPRRCCE